MIKDFFVNIDDIRNELKEIKESPEILLQVDSSMFSVLKEIIQIERRYLYGQDSTRAAKRRTAVQELLTDKLKKRVS